MVDRKFTAIVEEFVRDYCLLATAFCLLPTVPMLKEVLLSAYF